MKIAALIFGILAGLSSLPIAVMGHAIVGGLGGGGGQLLYLLPFASFLGGGLALNSARVAGGLMLAAAAAWLLLGVAAGYGINIITIGPLILNSLGGVFALLNGSEDSIANAAAKHNSPSPTVARPAAASSGYDTEKWKALLRFDNDIRAAADEVMPLGQKRYDELARSYLALGDKAYLGSIVQQLKNEAIAEAEIECTRAERASQPTQPEWSHAEEVGLLAVTSINSNPVVPDLLEPDQSGKSAPGKSLLMVATQDVVPEIKKIKDCEPDDTETAPTATGGSRSHSYIWATILVVLGVAGMLLLGAGPKIERGLGLALDEWSGAREQREKAEQGRQEAVARKQAERLNELERERLEALEQARNERERRERAEQAREDAAQEEQRRAERGQARIERERRERAEQEREDTAQEVQRRAEQQRQTDEGERWQHSPDGAIRWWVRNGTSKTLRLHFASSDRENLFWPGNNRSWTILPSQRFF